MHIADKLDRFRAQARANRWMRVFTVFVRIALAAGFLPSGFVKIMGQRFTGLSALHPMGHYLEALHRTGFYYPFIGVMQVSAAILLLIPRTALLGVLIYLPIILNICVLSFAVRFEGSLITSPLMVLACTYLLCWDYHKLKFILPWTDPQATELVEAPRSNKFPFAFAVGVVATMITVVLVVSNMFEIVPRNTIKDCRTQCEGSDKPAACRAFCDCIHQGGQPLDSCLKAYNKAPEEPLGAP